MRSFNFTIGHVPWFAMVRFKMVPLHLWQFTSHVVVLHYVDGTFILKKIC